VKVTVDTEINSFRITDGVHVVTAHLPEQHRVHFEGLVHAPTSSGSPGSRGLDLGRVAALRHMERRLYGIFEQRMEHLMMDKRQELVDLARIHGSSNF
jgi:hypothetical protein